MYLTGKRGETEILCDIKRHYREYFDKLPDQSWLWHRIRQALPLIERLRIHLRDQPGVQAEELRILDSMPIPVATSTSRPERAMASTELMGAVVPAKTQWLQVGLTHH